MQASLVEMPVNLFKQAFMSFKSFPFNRADRSLINPCAYKKDEASKICNQRIWFMWLIVLGITFVIQAFTFGLLPNIGQDEVQITEYGRLTLSPTSDWSVTWLIAEEKPLLLWSYIGPLIAELGYYMGGYSGVGPRVAALLGAALAASMALGWLLSRKVPVYAAWWLSLIFLLDPLFGLSQRMGRVDSWVIALCLASCWLLSASTRLHGPPARLRVMAAGALSAIAALVWPSAVFLYPIIFLEFINMVRAGSPKKTFWSNMAANGFYFLVSAIIVLFLLLVPIWKNIAIIVNDMRSMVKLNVRPSTPFSERILGLLDYHNWLKVIKAFIKTYSPFLPLLALLGAFCRRDYGLVLVTLSALALIFATLIYEFRVLYLLPYFIALAAGSHQGSFKIVAGVGVKRFSIVSLILVVVFSAGISLAARPILAFKENEKRNPEQLYQAAKTFVGPGNLKVFMAFTYEFYYAGRSLGWQLYTPYILYGYDSLGNWTRENDYEPKEKFVDLLSNMDYAIFPQSRVTMEIEKQLSQSGLEYQLKFSVNKKPEINEGIGNGNRISHILYMFLCGCTDYGPYLLYARNRNGNMTQTINKTAVMHNP